MPGNWQYWRVKRPDDVWELHIVPVDDLASHDLRSGQCACRPQEDTEAPNMWAHHSYDGREEYEQGRRTH